ncbi:TraY domain-containing protein, partial [Roseibacillus ishigakijimensis]
GFAGDCPGAICSGPQKIPRRGFSRWGRPLRRRLMSRNRPLLKRSHTSPRQLWQLKRKAVSGLLYTYSRLSSVMLAIRLKPDLEERLAKLAKRTGRTKTFYARQAIEQHLEDLEDYYLAAQSLEKSKRTFTPAEAKRELGL